MQGGWSDSVVGVIHRASRVRVRNILNPALWLCAVSTPTCLVFAWLAGFQSAVGWVLVCVGVLPVISTVLAFFLFAWKAPDRLQSEEFVLENRRLLLMSKEVRQPLPADDLPAGTNPEIPPGREAP